MSFLDEAKGINIRGASLETLEAFYVQLRSSQEDYVRLAVPQPNWMGGKLAEMDREVQYKREMANRVALDAVNAELLATLGKKERRAQLEANRDALMRKLNIPVPVVEPVKAEPATPASPTLEPAKTPA